MVKAMIAIETKLTLRCNCLRTDEFFNRTENENFETARLTGWLISTINQQFVCPDCARKLR